MSTGRIAIVSSRYPAAGEPYNHMFVHARAREYRRAGFDVTVLVPGVDQRSYSIDQIDVVRAPATEIARRLAGYDVVMVHLLHLKPFTALSGGPVYEALIRDRIPTLLFLHGVEAQRLRDRRREDIDVRSPISIGRWLYHDFWRLRQMRSIVETLMEVSPRFRVVVPSIWFLGEAERGLGVAMGRVAEVIPNGVDTRLFRFNPPSRTNSTRVLSIRPLRWSGKYAVDLAIDTFREWDTDVRLTLCGAGPDAARIGATVSSMGSHRIDLRVGFLEPAKIPELHREHAVYLAVTRMDAQGVSMCEAMASGLPVVSFSIDAIPEFVEHGVSGYLAKAFDVASLRQGVDQLCHDFEMRERFALAGRARMEAIDISKTCRRELGLVWPQVAATA